MKCPKCGWSWDNEEWEEDTAEKFIERCKIVLSEKHENIPWME